MRPNERRAAIFDALCIRRQDTVENLASEFGVSEKTIRRDIEELSCSYPIETVRGRYGGGVKVADWYHQNRKTLELFPMCSQRGSSFSHNPVRKPLTGHFSTFKSGASVFVCGKHPASFFP